MKIKQFEYKPLSHYSYAIISGNEMAIIDPERDPMQYYELANAENAKIKAVIETHPHADFVSSHLQIHKETGATIYNSKKLGAEYPHEGFDEGNSIKIGEIKLKATNTPGHSPDSICILAESGNDKVLFTGDTLFIGDVGRPDLRESAGNMKAKRKDLAEAMYTTIQTKFNHLPDETLIYPAHGAGSLCGKNLSSDSSSTLGNERVGNWAFKKQTKDEFVDTLLDSQPFIPHYFGYAVDTNKAGASNLRKAIGAVPLKLNTSIPNDKRVVIDARDEADFKKGHFKGSINIMAVSENAKFETWLGAIVKPEEEFYLVIENPGDLEKLLNRIAKIGYEKQLKAVFTLPHNASFEKSPQFNLNYFKQNRDKYTIIDIRNPGEVQEGKFFKNAISIPLNRLRSATDEIPIDKPILVHCAGGYRSAAGSSIISSILKDVDVYDLSDAVSQFK